MSQLTLAQSMGRPWSPGSPHVSSPRRHCGIIYSQGCMISGSCCCPTWGTTLQSGANHIVSDPEIASLQCAGAHPCSPDSLVGCSRDFRLQHIGSHRLPWLVKCASVGIMVKWANHREPPISGIGAAIKRGMTYRPALKPPDISVGNPRQNRGYKVRQDKTKQKPSSTAGLIVAEKLSIST